MTFLEGVDLSKWQPATPSLNGLSFAFAKATEGVTVDPMFATHMAAFRKAGIVTGAYHFARRDVSISAQITKFLVTAKGVDLLALDVEGVWAPSPTQVRIMVGLIHAAGRTVGLYHSESGFLSVGQDWNWVANYNRAPVIKCLFWQYGPRVIGGKSIDGDHFFGTAADLAKLAHKTPPTDVSPSPPSVTDPYGNPNQPGSLDYVEWMHSHGYVQVSGKWTKVGSVPQPVPAPVPVPSGTANRAGTPVLPTDDIEAMHAAGYWMQNGKWVAGTTPAPTPTPTPASVPPTTPKAPPIPTTPTSVGADAKSYPTSVPASITFAGLPVLRYGSSGPAFLLVHGGPEPFGTMAGMLSDLGYRIAARGGQAFMIDYHSDTWANAVMDVSTCIDAAKAVVNAPVTVVSHSFGGFPSSIAVLTGHGDAYVSVCSVCSLAAFGTSTFAAGAPDPVKLAANRPSVPVSVLRGQLDFTGTAQDDKQGFVNALHAAGHPGFYTIGPGDHTGTLYTDQTLDTLFATAELA